MKQGHKYTTAQSQAAYLRQNGRNASGQIGLYGEGKNIGGFVSTDANMGLLKGDPQFNGSIGLDFFLYGKKGIDPQAYFAGTSVNTSVQLGVFIFTKTSSTDFNTPYIPNKGLTIYSIDLALKPGVGVTKGMGNTWFKDFSKTSDAPTDDSDEN